MNSSSNTAPAITATTTTEEYQNIINYWYALRDENGALRTDREKAIMDLTWDEQVTIRDGVFQPGHKVVIGTHNGQAHADEALAIALIALFVDVDVVRTRDEKKLSECDLRVDVGEGLLDHHGSRHVVGISAATRVWQLLNNYTDMSWFLDIVRKTAEVDTGIDIPDKPFPWFHTLWAAEIRRGVPEDEVFQHVFDRVYEEILALMENCRAAEEAKAAAEAALEAAGEGARVVVFDAAAREAEVKKLLWDRKSQAIFYVSPESPDDWRILCCAPTDAGYSYFASARLIPEKFRGLRGSDLDQATGLQGGIFCHQAGFIAGFKTREAAEAFANLCLQD